MFDEKNIVGYCGMYCGACAIRTGEIRDAITRLRELVNAYQLSRVAQLFGGIEGFPQFLKTLDDLENMFGSCLGCRNGGGWHDCSFRKCCLEKGLKSCYECEKMPCERLLEFHKRHLLIPAPHY